MLAHGVDADGLGFWFSGDERHTACERAVLAGNIQIADLLLTAGANPTTFDSSQEFVSGCLSVDRQRVAEMLGADPTIAQQAISQSPTAILRAAELRRPDAVGLLAKLGFDVNAVDRISALHEAASTGDLAMVELLLSLGADPTLRDRSFDATPSGWAEHGHHHNVVDLLAAGPIDEAPNEAGPNTSS